MVLESHSFNIWEHCITLSCNLSSQVFICNLQLMVGIYIYPTYKDDFPSIPTSQGLMRNVPAPYISRSQLAIYGTSDSRPFFQRFHMVSTSFSHENVPMFSYIFSGVYPLSSAFSADLTIVYSDEDED